MNKIVQKLENEGLPKYWQKFITVLVLISLAPLMFNDKYWISGLFLFTSPFFIIGLQAAIRAHKEISIPLIILSGGIALSGVSEGVQKSIHFNIPISPEFALILKEAGILMIIVFAFQHILMFEKKFNIKGLTIDYILLTTSGLFLFLTRLPHFDSRRR